MNTPTPIESNTPSAPQTLTPEPAEISIGNRLVLWMFLVFFVLFGLIIVADLITGFFR